MKTARLALPLLSIAGAHAHRRILDATLWRCDTGVAALATPPLPPVAGDALVELDLVAVSEDVEASLRIDSPQGPETSPDVVPLARRDGALRARVSLPEGESRITMHVHGAGSAFVASDLRITMQGASTGRPRLGVVLHLTRADLWMQMSQYISHVPGLERLYACLSDSAAEVAPFIEEFHPGSVLRVLEPADDGAAASMEMIDVAMADGIELLAFLHTRASPYVGGSDAGRFDVTHKLAGSPGIVEEIVALFEADPRLGVVASAGHLLFGEDRFLATGSMFWARTQALREKTPGARGWRLRETPVPDSASQSAFDFAEPDDAAHSAGPLPAPIGLGLRPLQGLEAVDASAGRWRALHNDPQFRLDGLEALSGRWVMVTLGLQAPFAAQQPAVYFDVGEGWSPLASVHLARPGDEGVSRTVCCLPRGIRQVRLDPLAHPGPFAITHVEACELTVAQAVVQLRLALGSRATGYALASLHPAYVAMLAEADLSYASWIRHYEVPARDYAVLAASQASWMERPMFSIVVDTRDGEGTALDESLQAQLYPHWERLCARDAASLDAALAQAKGQFIAVARANDRLHPLALHYLAESAARHPGARILYTDEDTLLPDGTRADPWFKCEPNRDLMLAMDAISSLTCWRVEAAREAGGFREAVSEAEAYDLTLRVAALGDASGFVHVPRVLYHAASRRQPMPEAAKRAVADCLESAGLRAQVDDAPGAPALRRVRYRLPYPAPEVAIIIPTRDRAELLRACVDSIRDRTTYRGHRIVIVDNGSAEPETLELLERWRNEGIAVIRDDREFNFAALNNRAVAETNAEFVCLLNNDVEIVSPDWLDEMVSQAAQEGVGAVGASLWYPDGRLQHGGLILGIAGLAGYAHRLLPHGDTGYAFRAVLQQSFSAVTAACLVVKRGVYQGVGGMDERFAVAFNDVDFCLRLRESGYRNVWTPYAELVHHESATRGAESTPEKAARLQREIDLLRARWGASLFADPAYSPNLTLDAEDFSLAWPPRIELSPIIAE